MKQRIAFHLTLLFFLFSIPVFLLVCGFCLPAQYEETFLGALKYKCERLENAKGKRIVIVGGSGVAFGTDSALLEQELPAYTVVNFGMYAALGTKVMLDLSRTEIRAGDIVVISPEQNSQTLSEYFNAESLWQGIDGAYSLLSRVREENRPAMIGQFPYFAAKKCFYALSGAPQPKDIYRKSSFNEYGDILPAERGYNVMAAGYDTTTPVFFTEEVATEAFFALCNDYAAELAAKGATVYYRFCPVNTLAVKAGDCDAYFDYLQSKLSFPVIGTPQECRMDAEWFYDSNFHLNASGAIVNTRNLVRDLKAMLGDSSPTHIVLPEKPEIPEKEVERGDDSQAHCFAYEAFADGWRIVGVTEEGKRLAELIVPTYYADKPVYALGEYALQGCLARRIILQENLSSLADFVFADCEALERIVLLQRSPSACQVGQNLLYGTSADIYVPGNALSDYKVHYFWSAYASRLFAAEE